MNGILAKLVLGGGGAALLTAGALAAGAPAAFAAAPSPAAAAPKAGAGDSSRHAAMRLIRRAEFVSEAQVLGVKPKDLRADLKNGQTVEQLAQAKGMDKSQFETALVAALKPRLDALVDRGAVTRGQADAAIDRIQKGHVPFWKGIHDRDGDQN